MESLWLAVANVLTPMAAGLQPAPFTIIEPDVPVHITVSKVRIEEQLRDLSVLGANFL